MICNEGYTIERYIHGWDAVYNDIQPWDVKSLPVVFGAKDQYKGYRVQTRDELTKLFANKEFGDSSVLQVRGRLLSTSGRLSKLTSVLVGGAPYASGRCPASPENHS